MKEHREDSAANDIWGRPCQRLLTTTLRSLYTLYCKRQVVVASLVLGDPSSSRKPAAV
jgi:hypothetical protein